MNPSGENTFDILNQDTVALDDENSALVIIDQTLLPSETRIVRLRSTEEIWDAIHRLRVRGAPAIGVAAGFGIYLAAKAMDTEDSSEFARRFTEAKEYLASSRPTAVNLFWALNRMEGVMRASLNLPVPQIKERLLTEAMAIRQEDIDTCRKIGEYGLSLVKSGDGLLTHCNAGHLCATRYGTATAPMYLGHERGYDFKIFADETRPLLQGARLTAYELSCAGMDVTLICDNMSASVMKKGWIDAVFVGCDRVASNGDTANKIGTSVVAAVAKRYNVPMYICAPTSTIDMDTPDGDHIVIEERPAYEIKEMWYEKPMAPESVNVYNPAFDVTDADLITAIVTEYGIARPPFTQSLREIMRIKSASRLNIPPSPHS